MVKKDVACPETKKDLLRKVKSAISSTAERFSGNMQNVSFPLKLMYMTRYAFQLRLCAHIWKGTAKQIFKLHLWKFKNNSVENNF